MVNKATVGALAGLLVMSEVIGARGVEITATVAGITAAAAATAVANITFMKVRAGVLYSNCFFNECDIYNYLHNLHKVTVILVSLTGLK